MNYKIRLSMLILLLIFSPFVPVYAEEEVENLIDIFESENKVIAVIEGKKTRRFHLPSREKVIQIDSDGYLGAFFTTDRFAVISTSSSNWNYIHLHSDESKDAILSLSPKIALLVTEDRIISYLAASNKFNEIHLPIHNEIIEAKAEKNVAVVATTSYLFAWTAKSPSFNRISLRLKETVQEIKTSSHKIIVRTSDRLLTFEKSNATWKEYRLH